MMDNSLRQNLLTYIGYCLNGNNRRFSYSECSRAFSLLKIKHELTTLRKEFSLAKKERLIDFKPYYHKPEPFLTQKGRLEIKTRLPYRSLEHDDKWRLVLFNIPEKARLDRFVFQRELEALGFAKYTHHAYISPHPLFTTVNRLSRERGIRQYLKFLEAEIIDNGKNMDSLWPLDKINRQYKNFIEACNKTKRDPFWPLKAKKTGKTCSRKFIATILTYRKNFYPKSGWVLRLTKYSKKYRTHTRSPVILTLQRKNLFIAKE